MNPLFRPDEDALGGLLTGMTPQEAGNLPAPGLNAVGGLLAGLGEALPGRGSLRRAWEGSDLRQGVQNALDTASYYAGPHLSNRAEAVAAVAPMLTPQFGTVDARAAGEAFGQGRYGRGAGLLGLGVAGGLLDALPGEAAVKGLLKGLHGAAHYAPDLGMAVAPIKAFHGSPHDFDRFDISRIGTGEGAQAYGHGLYFAGNEDVARSYRDALSARNVQKNSPEDLAAKALTYAANDPQRAAQRLRDQMGEWRSAPPSMRGSLDEARFQDALALVKSGQPLGGGRMYEVGIHADPDRFLNWDKPINEQAAPVQDILRNPSAMGLEPQVRTLKDGRPVAFYARPSAPDKPIGRVMPGSEQPPAEWFAPHQSAQSFYRSELGAGNSDLAGASRLLRDAGIPGIRYLDQGSRAAGEGSRNTVTFSDDIVEIMRKYGLAGLGLGVPAAMAAQQQFQPQR